MARYVDIENSGKLAEAMYNLLSKCHLNYKVSCFADDCNECIRRFLSPYGSSDFIPTADVEPVVHARWSEKMVAVKETAPGYHSDDVRFGFKCSECGAVLNKTKYCGNCGARMDGESVKKGEPYGQ